MSALSLWEAMARLRWASRGNPAYQLDSAAGRWILLALSPSEQDARALAIALAGRPDWADASRLAAFAIRPGPPEALPATTPAGLVWLGDTAAALAGAGPRFVLLDPQMRLVAEAPARDVGRVLRLLEALPPPDRNAGAGAPAPVLVVPRIFEPGLCEALIALFETAGGKPSGVMRDVEGRTRLVLDARHKTRRDSLVPEAHPRHAELRRRIARRLLPELLRAFQFRATRIERDLIVCYDAEEQGHFAPHRDNTTLGAAHRRLAVTINLNAEAFEGGDLVFPEFGPRRYRAPTGGAFVFSCSLLHEVKRVTRGRRFAFVPFLCDEAAAAIHEANRRHVDA